ncbi:MAG TPA: hypothetical protein VEQ85_06760, partial [Lacipirellulaceae bacterium]|nr:hypothetical protein [Lacipirellulaceae bacterium]
MAAALSGCRAVDNAQVDVIERELRQQEDYIYELEDYLMEYSEKLRECRACQTPLQSGAPAPGAARRQSSATLPGEPTIADDARRSSAPRRPNGTRAAPPTEAADQGADAFDAPLPAERPTAPALEMEPAPG